MKQVDYMAVAERAMAQIKKGAFLTVRVDDQVNTMTIGWATIGFCWRKPVFMVAVRDSRHTFSLIENAPDFTVSVPAEHMKDEIMYCGTKSGKDVDKFSALNLGTMDGRQVLSPVIDIAGTHFECRIVYKSAMNPGFMVTEFEKLYPEKDYHTLYFGEIVACYETD
jgi:flavin reductase (DIM6/NTAB) family NADH-FMN oxidoreductase RutF